MIVQCPNCGQPVVVNGLGRKRLNMPLKNILDACRRHKTIVYVAQELGCSPAYISGVLKANGLRSKNVIGK